MLVPVLLFIVGLLFLIKGGDWFVDGASALARRFHLPELLIGATVVSIGTTLPEVMVSTMSAVSGHGEIAYGNAIGSVICNSALIAAITIAVRPGKVDPKTLRVPVAFFFAAAAIYCVAAYAMGEFTRPLGFVMLAMFVAYMVANVLQMKKAPAAAEAEAEAENAGEEMSLTKTLVLLVLGAVLGLLFTFIERFFHSRSKRMSISVGFVFLAVGLAMLEWKIGAVTVGFSSLLVCMVMGTVFCNLCDFSEELMDRMDRWTGPVMVLFFVISGAELQLEVFSKWQIVLIGLVFILVRSLGKITGAGVSSRFMKCEPTVQKYLGITLLPQAGVCLGMSQVAVSTMSELGFAEVGLLIRNISLFAVLVYELIGPLLTKIALDKAGEIKEKPIPPRKLAAMQKKQSK